MEDDLQTALSAAYDAAPLENATPEVVPEKSVPEVSGTPDATPQAEGRARDESGRFAKAPAQADAPAQPQVPPAAPSPDAVQQPPAARTAPGAWKKDLAEKHWNQLAPEIQEEILRREGDFHKGIEGWKGHAEKGKAFEKVMAPYQETLQKLGVDGPTAVSALLQADHVLRNAPPAVKVQQLMAIAKQYGVDLSQEFAPDVAQYQAELYRTQEQLRQIQLQAQQQSSMTLNSEIERFASDFGHERFEALRAPAAALLESGVAKDLQQAFDMAAYANPTTRAELLEQQQRKQEEANRAQRASAAAVGVKGSSPASGAPSATRGSLRGDIEAAFENHT